MNGEWGGRGLREDCTKERGESPPISLFYCTICVPKPIFHRLHADSLHGLKALTSSKLAYFSHKAIGIALLLLKHILT